MGATSKTFVDDNPPQVEAADINGLNDEQKNLIEDSGQVFSAADQEQQSKAASNFAANGNFYGDSGAADAYVLTPIGNALGITEYSNGQRFRFRPANTNTGASTVAVNGLAAKDIKDMSGSALIAGTIIQDDYCEIEYDSVAGYFKLLQNVKSILIQDFSTVGNVGDTSQFLAGHVLTSDEETLIGSMIAMYNLSDNTDLSGNTNTLSAADAYNAAAGILNVATSAHLGVNGQHLQADGIDDFSGTGDLDISIGGWHKPLASAGLLACGTNAAAQKIQYYTDATGFLVFDIAGITYTYPRILTGSWHHIALVYDKTNSLAYVYIDASHVATIAATTNIDIQATPSIWINSKTDGTLEVASYHDECFVYEGVLSEEDINLLAAAKITEPAALSGKNYLVIEETQNDGDTSYKEQGYCQVVTKYNGYLYLQPYQYTELDKVKLTAGVI